VLCTDGIRKSCASDADFLALAAWLAAGPDPSATACDTVVSHSPKPGALHPGVPYPGAPHPDTAHPAIGGSDTGEGGVRVDAFLVEGLESDDRWLLTGGQAVGGITMAFDITGQALAAKLKVGQPAMSRAIRHCQHHAL
jgi:hypothetical protein